MNGGKFFFLFFWFGDANRLITIYGLHSFDNDSIEMAQKGFEPKKWRIFFASKTWNSIFFSLNHLTLTNFLSIFSPFAVFGTREAYFASKIVRSGKRTWFTCSGIGIRLQWSEKQVNVTGKPNRHIQVRETTERMVTKCKILHGIRANCVFCDTFRRFLASLFHVWV